MSTPVLNKKQQKTTLSAKKSRVKETIKNVLATPYKNSYWPMVPSEDNKFFEDVLRINLPRMKEKFNVPWKELKNIPKPERKKFREEYSINLNVGKINKEESKDVHVGVNSVTKLLESKLASIVLLSSDVEPRLMVQHIIDLSVLYRVPVLIVENLRILLQHHCGINSTSFSLTKNVSLDTKLLLIKQATEQIFKKIPAPVNHINYTRSVNRIERECENIVYGDEEKSKKELVDERAIKELVYLKRSVKNRRIFIPQMHTADDMDIDKKCFIAFSQETDKIEKTESTYKSLVVKRLKGDHGRRKKKAKLLKVTTT